MKGIKTTAVDIRLRIYKRYDVHSATMISKPSKHIPSFNLILILFPLLFALYANPLLISIANVLSVGSVVTVASAF